MQTVILPGYSPENRSWADLVAVRLNFDGQIRPIFWDHWLDPEQLFYAREKANLISKHARGDTLNVIAHSIGTVVAAYLISFIPDQINKVILCGLPLNDISQEEKALVGIYLPTLDPINLLCIQNENDPHATYNEVRGFLPATINLVSKPRNDHYYPYFEDFDAFINNRSI